jgi:DNA invertase Pin-like site-specific DNA recombinase
MLRRMSQQPAAYLRKSKINSDRHLSWEVQESEIRALADKHGDNAKLLLFSDWGRSGRGDKLRHRKEYARLLEMIGAGKVSAVYGYSMSRLARSLVDYVRLAELCRDHGVPIRLAKEGELDYTTPHGRLLVNLLASVAQAEADWAKERAVDTIAVRVARGDYIGKPAWGYRVVDGRLERAPGEDPELVIAAYREAGSLIGAARVLNGQGIAPRGGALWSENGVRAVLGRDAPPDVAAMVARTTQGAKAVVHAPLARLLRCPCGTLLTPQVSGRRYVSYFCSRGYRDPGHPRPYNVSEAKVLPWVRAEAARLRTPERVTLGEQNATKRAELTAQRERLGWALTDGLLNREDAAKRAAEIEAEMEHLDVAEEIIEVPTIDWTWEPAAVNGVLRTLWEHVELDANMQPVRAMWRVPEWRA